MKGFCTGGGWEQQLGEMSKNPYFLYRGSLYILHLWKHLWVEYFYWPDGRSMAKAVLGCLDLCSRPRKCALLYMWVFWCVFTTRILFKWTHICSVGRARQQSHCRWKQSLRDSCSRLSPQFCSLIVHRQDRAASADQVAADNRRHLNI